MYAEDPYILSSFFRKRETSGQGCAFFFFPVQALLSTKKVFLSYFQILFAHATPDKRSQAFVAVVERHRRAYRLASSARWYTNVYARAKFVCGEERKTRAMLSSRQSGIFNEFGEAP